MSREYIFYIWNPFETCEVYSSRGRYLSMATLSMNRRAYRVSYFVTVQLIALVGWIIVQSIFTLTVLSTVPFVVVMVIETIWWIATLVIMFVLFRRIYNGFVQSVLDLEEANRKLRERTNSMLFDQMNRGDQGEAAP